MGFSSNKSTPTAVTQLTGGTPSTVWFADANGIVQELPIGAAGTVLTAGASGANPTWTTPSGGGGGTVVMTGANGTVAGTAGYVPAPAATDNVKYLRGDGTWQVVASGGSDPVVAYGYLFSDSVAAHQHEFSLTAAELATVMAGGSVNVTSSTTSSHQHTVSVSKSSSVNGRLNVSSDIVSSHLHQGGVSDLGPVFGGATSTTNGRVGNVPRPNSGEQALFLRGDGQWAAAGGGGAHSALTGLTTGDDHTQYHNDARGDARYALLAHTHTFASLTSKPTTISGYGITDFNTLGDARWAALSHNHDSTYATVGHLHTGVYAPVAHSHTAFTGDTGTGGTAGFVPAPAAGDASAGKFLKADGTWSAPPAGGGGTGSTATDWVAFTPVIEGVTTNPTQGATVDAKCMWRRDGSDMLINFFYEQSGGAGANGSGTYKFKLPPGYTIDVNKIRVGTYASATDTAQPVGNGAVIIAGSDGGHATVFAYDATSLVLQAFSDSLNQLNFVGSTWFQLVNTDIQYAFTARVPIVGWSAVINSQSDVLGTAAFSGAGGTISNLVMDGIIAGITRLATGRWQVTFTTPQPDINYVQVLSALDDDVAVPLCYARGTALTTTGFEFYTYAYGPNTPRDFGTIRVAILRKGVAGTGGGGGSGVTSGDDANIIVATQMFN